MIGNLLIIGDSYSTYEGYNPEGYAVYYSKEGRGDPEFMVTKMDVRDTWWMRLVSSTDAHLVHNNSWSGSTLCYTGYSGDCSHTSSFIYRYRQLKAQGFFEENKIDTVLVFGGTNDSWANAPLGELKYDNFEESDLFSVLPAFSYFMKTLKEDLPESRIVFIANCDIKVEIVEAIKTLGEHFGIEVVALSGITKEHGHPNAQGMKEIFEQAKAVLEK